MAMAHAVDDVLVSMSATHALAYVLMRQGWMAESEALAVRTAKANEPRSGEAQPAQLAEWGHLLNIGMRAAVRQKRYSHANDLLGLAQLAAHRLDGDYVDDYQCWYGPTMVAMKAVEVAAESGEYAQALYLATSVSPSGGTAKHTRMSYLLDVANAHAHENQPDDAVAVLLDVRSQAAELLHYKVLAREIVRMLLDMRGVSRSRSEALRELAAFLNVQV